VACGLFPYLTSLSVYSMLADPMKRKEHERCPSDASQRRTFCASNALLHNGSMSITNIKAVQRSQTARPAKGNRKCAPGAHSPLANTPSKTAANVDWAFASES